MYTHIYVYLSMYSPTLKLAVLVGIASASQKMCFSQLNNVGITVAK